MSTTVYSLHFNIAAVIPLEGKLIKPAQAQFEIGQFRRLLVTGVLQENPTLICK